MRFATILSFALPLLGFAHSAIDIASSPEARSEEFTHPSILEAHKVYSPRSCNRATFKTDCAGKTPPHSNFYCLYGKCAWECKPNFHRPTRYALTCIPDDRTCGNHNCVAPKNGYTTCETVKGQPTCVVHCKNQRHLVNGRCESTANNPNLCGPKRVVCPGPYLGNGKALCRKNTCSIQCSKRGVLSYKNGLPICSK